MKHKGYRSPLLMGVALGLAFLLALGLGGIASAANQPPGAARALELPAIGPGLGIFELDGNATTQNTTCANLPDDWSRLNPPAPTCSHAKASSFVVDPAGESIFTGGGSKDEHAISEWRWTNGSVPDKDNLTDVYAAAYTNGSDLMIYFGADRFANNGDANIGFWFFQKAVGTNPDGTFSGTHTVGDLFVVSAFTSGGRVSTVDVYRWDDTTPLALVVSGNDCSLSTRNEFVCATVNTGPTPSVWPYTPKSGSSGTFPTGSFFEGGINLTQLGIGGCFTSYLAETRSSQTLNAQLKDFAMGTLNTCCDITVTASLTPSCNAEFGYSAQAKNAAGSDIAATYAWSCNDGALTWTGQTETKSVAAGTYTCKVTASQASYPTCLATSTEKTVTVYPALGATAGATASCNLGVPFTSSGSGGSGTYSYSWSFDVNTADACTGSAATKDVNKDLVSPGGTCNGRVTVKDTGRVDTLVCTKTADAAAAGYPAMGATAGATASCTLDVPFTSSGSGGSGGGYKYDWSFDVNTSDACSGSVLNSQNPTKTLASPGGNCNGQVTVTDTGRTDKVCTAIADATAAGFPPVVASAGATPSCSLTVPFTSSASGGSGTTYSYSWSFDVAVDACSGSTTTQNPNKLLDSPGGNCKGEVTATDTGRTDKACTGKADATAAGFVPLGVTPSLTSTCNMGVLNVDDATYNATKSGGSPAGVTYSWGFSSPTLGCSVSPTSSTFTGGGLDVTPAASRGPCVVNAAVTVTDGRTDITTCTAIDNTSTTVYAPIQVSIAPDATGLACMAIDTAGTDVTYTATVTGGKPLYIYTWTVGGDNTATACGNSASCLVDSAATDYCAGITVKVNVEDTSICPAVDSNTGVVTKTTSVTAS